MSNSVLVAPSGIKYPIEHSGAGTPLLLLHGFTGSRKTWDGAARYLPSNYPITTLDLPGHGESVVHDASASTFATVVDDLSWIITETTQGAVDVLGYSMGGRLALALAIAYPAQVNRLILESASPGIADEQERRLRQTADEHLADRILLGGLEQFVDDWERLSMWESQRALPEVDQVRQREIRLGQSATGLAASLRFMGTGTQPSYWSGLPDLCMPVLLIAGELDHKFTQIATQMHEAIPASRLEVFSGAGHAVHLEQTERYARLVSNFLQDPGIGETPS